MISKHTFKDCELLLEKIAKKVPLPLIELKDGLASMTWKLESRVVSVMLRGDSYLIYSVVLETGEIKRGIADIRYAPKVLLEFF
jgi:hypothetical protein